MKILISNDDSIYSHGIQSLQDILGNSNISHFITSGDNNSFDKKCFSVSKHDIWLIAPEKEQSAKSHSFTMRSPLFLKYLSDRSISLDGTPADCVYFALTHFKTTLGKDDHGTDIDFD